MNTPALNCNTGKMYVPEIFNHLLGADGSTNMSNQVIEVDLQQVYTEVVIVLRE